MKEVVIDGVRYVEEAKVSGDYVIIRNQNAGVFAGTLVRRNGREVELANARRLWMWVGAASLSELAVEGVARPKECKFPVAVPTIILTEAIEVLPCTDKARTSIEGVPVWTAR